MSPALELSSLNFLLSLLVVGDLGLSHPLKRANQLVRQLIDRLTDLTNEALRVLRRPAFMPLLVAALEANLVLTLGQDHRWWYRGELLVTADARISRFHMND